MHFEGNWDLTVILPSVRRPTPPQWVPPCAPLLRPPVSCYVFLFAVHGPLVPGGVYSLLASALVRGRVPTESRGPFGGQRGPEGAGTPPGPRVHQPRSPETAPGWVRARLARPPGPGQPWGALQSHTRGAARPSPAPGAEGPPSSRSTAGLQGGGAPHQPGPPNPSLAVAVLGCREADGTGLVLLTGAQRPPRDPGI